MVKLLQKPIYGKIKIQILNPGSTGIPQGMTIRSDLTMEKIITLSLWDMQEKQCTICHETKPLTEFYKHPTCLLGVLAQCKLCYIARQLDRTYKRPQPIACTDCGEEDQEKFPFNPNGKRAGNRCKKCIHRHQPRFGISHAQRDEMSRDQGDGCAICGKAETSVHQDGTLRRLAIDHDHKTGKVRGLLCFQCNALLGRTDDDIEKLKKVIVYLKRYLPDER